MQVCDCVCGRVGYLITRCGTPSCLHPQINNAGDRRRDQSSVCTEGKGGRVGEEGYVFKTSSDAFTFFFY